MSAEKVEVIAVGVCGSDVQRLRAGYAVRSLGHELVGRRAGSGELVAIRPLNPCRVCPACKQGWTEHCASDTSIGRLDTAEGGFSGRVRADAGQLYPVPPQLPAPLATLADPLACILHGLYGVLVDGVEVLVVGDDPMAALAAVYARRQGAGRVTIAVKTADRVGHMSVFGDCVVEADELRLNHYDVAVEAVGGVSSEPISVAVAAVAPLGQVVALGVYPPHVTAGFPVRKLLEKESTLRGSKSYRVHVDRDDFATALGLLVTDHGAYAPIVTSTPFWSPDGPQLPVLERRNSALKIVYVNESATADDAKL